MPVAIYGSLWLWGVLEQDESCFQLLAGFIYRRVCSQVTVCFSGPSGVCLVAVPIKVTFSDQQKGGEGTCLVSSAQPLSPVPAGAFLSITEVFLLGFVCLSGSLSVSPQEWVWSFATCVWMSIIRSDNGFLLQHGISPWLQSVTSLLGGSLRVALSTPFLWSRNYVCGLGWFLCSSSLSGRDDKASLPHCGISGINSYIK